MSSALLKMSLALEDENACISILEELNAPVDDDNIARLRHVIETLGNVCQKAYEKMLREVGNERLALLDAKCECGAYYSISIYNDSFPDPDNETVH